MLDFSIICCANCSDVYIAVVSFCSVTQANRLNFNQLDYKAVFSDEQDKEALNQSEEQPSLCDLVTVKNDLHSH